MRHNFFDPAVPDSPSFVSLGIGVLLLVFAAGLFGAKALFPSIDLDVIFTICAERQRFEEGKQP